MRSSRTRRRFTQSVAAVLAALALPATAAQDYPSRPIRLIVPFPPGGTTDAAARVFAAALQERLGQPVVVDNRPGAGSIIGVEAVARAAPDGYTLLFGESGGMAVLPALKKKVPYDPVRDFTAIGFVARSPHVLVVNPKVPAHSLAEFIDYVKSRPGELYYGSAGYGAPGHIIMELLELQARINVIHVPFKGGGPALQALVAGEIDMMMMGPAGLTPRVDTGQLRALAQTGPTRHPMIPNVPTMRELGTDVMFGREVNVMSWFGVLGPARVAQPIVLRLNRDMAAVLAQPNVQKRLIDIGCEAEAMSPKAFTQFIGVENRKWAQVLAAAHIEQID
ncbi:MAG: tripartite tricarboxylate transporter substrate binding protein [Burkholderiales bacterium]|nr:tripartite tricarboxylate transporter substrate binding protein [Burkholderiales bacterium]